jgi:hypothetical protein
MGEYFQANGTGEYFQTNGLGADNTADLKTAGFLAGGYVLVLGILMLLE